MGTRVSCRSLLLLVAASVVSAPAGADVLWTWQFGSESGVFVTNGSLADTASPGDFTIASFAITASAWPAHVGASYYVVMPPQGFQWDGSAATQFWRLGGIYTNGANFNLAMNDWVYLFLPGLGTVLDDDDNAMYRESLALTPVADYAAASIPLLSPAATLLLAVLLALAATWLLRR